MLSSAQDCQALELMLAGQAVALDALGALETLALLLSSTLGLMSPTLALVASSGLGRVPGSSLRTGSSPKFEAALGRLDHRGRAQLEDAGVITLVLFSACVALDTDRFEVDQDGFITEAESKCNPDTEEAGWAEGIARGPLFQEETPGDQRFISGMDHVIKSQ